MTQDFKNKEDWLRSQCNRLKNGLCSSTCCLERGGDDRKYGINRDYSMATCFAFEIQEEINSLRGRLDYLNRNY
jgi:hypothetical protein